MTDTDFEFIIEGVKNGFHVVNSFNFSQVECENYFSATNKSDRIKVEKVIRNEMLEGRYITVSEKPTIVSALGAIPKQNGGVRLIHDGSRPSGLALNDFASLDNHLRFQTLDDAVDMLKPGVFMAKVDLKSAYRSVRVHKSNWPACGLKWTFQNDRTPTYLIDTALPFGSRLAPGIFNKLTQAVRRMMARLGYCNVIAYLDDFLVVGESHMECLEALNTLVFLLRDLGFSIAWDKVEGPTKSLVFLGVQIDSVKACLELPPDKLIKFSRLIKDTLSQKRISLKQLQVLAGKLNWAAAVVRGGRVYLRRVIDMMKPMHALRHKALISNEMREDLLWWDKFLLVFNGKSWFHTTSQWVNVYVDASNVGGGMVWNN